MRYHGVWVDMCQIVKEGWYDVTSASWMWGWSDSRITYVLGRHGFQYDLVAGSISFDSIKNELHYSNRPIYVRYMYAFANGHAVVLCGYDMDGGQWVERMDPAWGGFAVCSYDWLLHGGTCDGWLHSWDATVRNIRR